MPEVLLDAAGRPRSPATLPGFHARRAPRNKRQHYPGRPTDRRGDRRGNATRRHRPARGPNAGAHHRPVTGALNATGSIGASNATAPPAPRTPPPPSRPSTSWTSSPPREAYPSRVSRFGSWRCWEWPWSVAALVPAGCSPVESSQTSRQRKGRPVWGPFTHSVHASPHRFGSVVDRRPTAIRWSFSVECSRPRVHSPCSSQSGAVKAVKSTPFRGHVRALAVRPRTD
jgi:hypothetical protein